MEYLKSDMDKNYRFDIGGNGSRRLLRRSGAVFSDGKLNVVSHRDMELCHQLVNGEIGEWSGIDEWGGPIGRGNWRTTTGF